MKVKDNSQLVPHKNFGFRDGTNTGHDYLYAHIGNMTTDLNKGIENIVYNHLNLPVKIDFSGSKPNIREINYVYDATGAKLEKQVTEAGTTVSTQYADGFIYNDAGGNGMELQFFSHPEGYVEPVAAEQKVKGFDVGGPGVTYSSYKYVFQYKDHLGNIRLSYSDADLNGSINPSTEIIEEKNYYPFGGIQKGYNNVVNGTAHPYGFGGKEENDELGLQWLDFGARNYDKWLGRWMNLDPQAEKMFNNSPYNYAFNNPLYFIDPDGELPWPVHIRSFISAKSVGGGAFRGDGRGPSTQSSQQGSTSRVKSSFTVDPAKGTATNLQTDSDATVFYGAGSPGVPGGYIPPMVEKPNPEASLDNISSGSENNISLDFKHSAKDPITPSLVTPDLDVQASLDITEDLENSVLNITGAFTGDAFPSTEAFITDQSGETNLLLGAHKEQGGLGKLFGENKRPTFNVNMQVNIDKKGNFTGVTVGKKTYTVEEWNKHVQSTFNNN